MNKLLLAIIFCLLGVFVHPAGFVFAVFPGALALLAAEDKVKAPRGSPAFRESGER